ncbi:ephrin type-B receptor 2-like isoform X2 [Xenia sp. Carnegie-2017]|uniref:ephrin type-B receptor 2-like isoform X2 n=1 Tax=Xenia sp. Carnegie-2017 TaxID=2897299 RepID=UPI001F042437|nr:ephrin type-B receptor 2-like isoform X2 [Xenia sp. Carnegie-2017]
MKCLLFLVCLCVCNGVREIIEDDAFDRRSFQNFRFENKGGENWNKKPESEMITVTTCGNGDVADFWFMTKHINLTLFANVDAVHVDIVSGFKECINQRGERADCHNNSLDVYANLSGMTQTFKNDRPKLDDIFSKFKFYSSIISNNKPNTTFSNQTNTISLTLNNERGITLAFRSRGACARISSIIIYTYYCNETFMDGVMLRKTSAPRDGIKNVWVNCSVNAIPTNNFTTLEGQCNSNGSWNIDGDLKCLCVEGYEPNTSLGCTSCSNRSFKSSVANFKCKNCPLGNIATENKTSCVCEDGFYRAKINQGNFSTCYALPEIPGPLQAEISDNNLTISWTSVSKSKNLINETVIYDIHCFVCENTDVCKEGCEVEFIPRQFNLTETFVVVRSSTTSRNYSFQVYAKNSLNYGVSRTKWKFKKIFQLFPLRKNGNAPTSQESDNTVFIVIVVVIVASLLLVMIFLCTFILKRRGKMLKTRFPCLPKQGVELPAVGRKSYVDPSNYTNPEEAIQEFANELDPDKIFLERLIGGGEFGDVYKGELTTSNGQKTPIAAKTLKPESSAKSARDFLLEASVMAQFDHPNVVRMEGVITKSTPRMIIIEYMANGSLDNYLQINDGILSKVQLLRLAKDVVEGMNYLSDINFIHRDLAARNVLLNNDMVCKISDFGLSREMESHSSGEYETSGGKIPLRWTAPEAIRYRKFTTASDVWSYGILLWEIMSFGQRPYWEWDNFKVMEEVNGGYRLPPPPANGWNRSRWENTRLCLLRLDIVNSQIFLTSKSKICNSLVSR